MQDGDRVRVMAGNYTDQTGELIGDPDQQGVCIKFDKDPKPNRITNVDYPNEAPTAQELLEVITSAPSHDTFGGLNPQPA